MDLTKKKAEIEAELQAAQQQLTEYGWKEKTLKAQLKKVNSFIEKANEILNDDNKQPQKAVDKDNQTKQ